MNKYKEFESWLENEPSYKQKAGRDPEYKAAMWKSWQAARRCSELDIDVERGFQELSDGMLKLAEVFEDKYPYCEVTIDLTGKLRKEYKIV